MTITIREVCACFYYISAGAILCLASSDDWKTTWVSGRYCLSLWAMVGVGWVAVNRGTFALIELVLLLILFYLPIELTMLGDADIVAIALYIAYYLYPGATVYPNVIVTLVPMVLLLCAMYPYAWFYYKRRGEKYRLFKGMYVPVFPVFALTWCVSGPIVAIIRLYIGFTEGGYIDFALWTVT